GADAPRGIEFELARGFAARLGVDLKIVVEDRVAQLAPKVGRREAHVAAASLSVTDDRREVVAFGPAYQSVEQQVVYRRGTLRPASIGDLVGGRIEVLAGSVQAALLSEALDEHPALIWREDPRATSEDLLRRVDAGVIDYAIVPSNAYGLLRHSYPEARAAFTVGSAYQVAWALPPGA